jgi:hypothetical protein
MRNDIAINTSMPADHREPARAGQANLSDSELYIPKTFLLKHIDTGARPAVEERFSVEIDYRVAG